VLIGKGKESIEKAVDPGDAPISRQSQILRQA
jgi:hypothetical protein